VRDAVARTTTVADAVVAIERIDKKVLVVMHMKPFRRLQLGLKTSSFTVSLM
jgi:hypothetical protein